MGNLWEPVRVRIRYSYEILCTFPINPMYRNKVLVRVRVQSCRSKSTQQASATSSSSDEPCNVIEYKHHVSTVLQYNQDKNSNSRCFCLVTQYACASSLITAFLFFAVLGMRDDGMRDEGMRAEDTDSSTKTRPVSVSCIPATETYHDIEPNGCFLGLAGPWPQRCWCRGATFTRACSRG